MVNYWNAYKYKNTQKQMCGGDLTLTVNVSPNIHKLIRWVLTAITDSNKAFSLLSECF